ncbi:MAG: PqqD family protein [Roseburia sp.]|nr:PqqD family protein [Roseburia sp.]
MKNADRYQLRYAAGQYWLLDMEQDGDCYREPICMNESGAFILEQYFLLGERTAVAQQMHERYGISVEQALADVEEFLQKLKEQEAALRYRKTGECEGAYE